MTAEPHRTRRGRRGAYRSWHRRGRGRIGCGPLGGLMVIGVLAMILSRGLVIHGPGRTA
jgi:hypothetical protein